MMKMDQNDRKFYSILLSLISALPLSLVCNFFPSPPQTTFLLSKVYLHFNVIFARTVFVHTYHNVLLVYKKKYYGLFL